MNPIQFKTTHDFNGFLEFELKAHDSLRVDSSKMVIIDKNVFLKLRLKGSVAGQAKGTFLDVYECRPDCSGYVLLGPIYKGHVEHLYLENASLYIVHRYFLASSGGIAINTQRRGGYKEFFKSSNLIVLKCYGQGDIWWNCFGSVIKVKVKGQKLVRLSQLVAFSEGVKLKVVVCEGLYSHYHSGEESLCEMTGEGDIWIQSFSVHHQRCWATQTKYIK